jgi:hypothetical protein
VAPGEGVADVLRWWRSGNRETPRQTTDARPKKASDRVVNPGFSSAKGIKQTENPEFVLNFKSQCALLVLAMRAMVIL